MQIKIDWMERKTIPSGKELIEGTFTGDNGQFEATIWKLDKENKVFPGFDEMAPGHTFEGNPWTSPKNGKISIYPPRAELKPPSFVRAPSGIKAAQERKHDNIREAQTHKEEGIMNSSTFRAAYETALAEQGNNFDEGVFQERFTFWREYYMSKWDIKQPF